RVVGPCRKLLEVSARGVGSPDIQRIAPAARCGRENDIASVIAGDRAEGWDVIVQQRRAIAAVGIHLKDAIFLLYQQFAVGRPAKPTRGRAAADSGRLSGALIIV